VTRTQLGLHARPCGILNVLGYYSPLLQMFDHAVKERFLKPENRALVLAGESPADLLQAPEQWRPIHVEKWLSPGDEVSRRNSPKVGRNDPVRGVPARNASGAAAGGTNRTCGVLGWKDSIPRGSVRVLDAREATARNPQASFLTVY
jgi:hypothetical protein